MTSSQDLTRRTDSWVVPTFGFFALVTLGGLLLVCGTTIIYFDHRFSGHWRPGPMSLVITTVGVSLVMLAMIGGATGRAHKTIVVVRNVLAGFVALVLLAIASLLLIGPMH